MSKQVNYISETLLEDGPVEDFQGATLQIQPDLFLGSRSPSDDSGSIAKLSLSPDVTVKGKLPQSAGRADNSSVPAVSGGADAVSPIASIPKRIHEKLKRSFSAPRTDMACQIPFLGEDEARDFFTSRNGLVENAIKECAANLVVAEQDGDVINSWLLTEISSWDNEKERLVLLTTRALFTVKYDFIALKQLEYRRIPLSQVDTLVSGDLIYPSGSLVPRLNGITTGVVTVVKGCLLRPLQQRWAHSDAANRNFCATSAFDFISFEPRSRNVRGLRVMWNRGEPLAFTKKWNPFSSEIPFTTFTSHPLLWCKEPSSDGNDLFDVEELGRNLVLAVEKSQGTTANCRIEHRSITLDNYIGLSSLIHNRNALGFFKVRGKFSF